MAAAVDSGLMEMTGMGVVPPAFACGHRDNMEMNWEGNAAYDEKTKDLTAGGEKANLDLTLVRDRMGWPAYR